MNQRNVLQAKLLGMLSFDFFEVLDSVTIARSRKHIERYYDTTDIGKFPTRLKPISRRPCLTDLCTAINYNEIYTQLQALNLAIYTPSDFILPSRIGRYIDLEKTGKESGLSMQGRGKGDPSIDGNQYAETFGKFCQLIPINYSAHTGTYSKYN